jgi:hypothetical protein
VLSPYSETTLRNPENPANTVAGLDYKYYEGSWSQLPNFDALTPVKVGSVSNFDLSVRNVDNSFGFKYTGFVNVPADGNYTFYTSSDDGSKLYIGTTQVVDNDGLHGTQERSGTIGLKAGKHAITVTFFEATVGEVLTVSYSSASLAKQIIPASALSHTSTGFSGTYKITARHSNKALDVTNSGTQDGANVQQWTANGTPAQQWIVTATSDGYYKLVNKASNKALEVSNNATTDGGNVQQWSYVGSNSQQWKIEATSDGFHRLINRHSGKVLDVSGNSTADGANVHQWTYFGGNNQQWKLEQISTATSRVASAQAEQAAAMGNTLRVYPNPVTSGRLTLQLNSREKGNATVTLTGAQGQVTVREQLSVEAGENTIRLSTHGSASGLYLLTVTQGSRRIVKKIHVQ